MAVKYAQHSRSAKKVMAVGVVERPVGQHIATG